MDWTDIEARLCERAEEVCRHLLPQGKREGANFVCGNVDGRPGDSLKVGLTGKVGVWADFADSGHKGKTLISLWCAVRGRPFKECIVEAKQFLGIADDFHKRVKAYPAPQDAKERPDESSFRKVAETWDKCQELTEGGPVWEYLVKQRCLDPLALDALGVREYLAYGKWAMVFPYYLVPTEEESKAAAIGKEVLGTEQAPAWLKFERLDRPEGPSGRPQKKEWTTPGPEKTLWGTALAQHPAFKAARHLLICEGEKDAVTWATYGCMGWGVLPVSVPFGAKWKGQDRGRPSPNREWLDRCWDWMQQFETIYIAMDSDEAGKRAAADIITEIGPRRCALVELPPDAQGKPFKDANDCLKAGVAAVDMKYAVEHAKDFAPANVVSARAFEAEFYAEWFEKHLEPGLQLPFGFPWRVRPGELTIWTGIEKSGKTTLLSFCLMALLAQGERAFVASYEVTPVKTLKKYSRQAYGGLLYDKRMVERCQADREDPKEALANYETNARQYARETFGWLTKGLWMNTVVGIGQWRQLLDDMRWARRRYGITQFVVDNFMRLGIAKDDYAQQADAITAFTALALELNVHVHMVVHQNKSGDKRDSGGKRAVSGAFEIIANAHNIVEVQRDERKGQEVKELFQKYELELLKENEFKAEKQRLDATPDGKFILHAQREGEEQNGSKYLWFLWESQQYADKPPGHVEHAPIKFVEAEKRKAHQVELPEDEPADTENNNNQTNT